MTDNSTARDDTGVQASLPDTVGTGKSEAMVVLPIIDQHGRVVGNAQRPLAEILVVEAFVDDDGTAWTPPTAWAYFAACRAHNNKEASHE